jgi:hypothetical protein
VEFTILMLMGVATAVGALGVAAGMERRWRTGRPPRQLLLQDQCVLTGEALFATGVDPSTVVFDCLVAPQLASVSDTALFQPLPVRAHHRASEEEPPLSSLVRTWADCGHRVFIELPAGDKPLRATLSCGDQAVIVDVDNGAEVRRALSAVA